jgi:hypothetical protein
MESVLIAAAVLACPLGMLVMGWFMAKGMRSSKQAERPNVDELRDEHRRLGAEIERLEGTEGDEADVTAGRR